MSSAHYKGPRSQTGLTSDLLHGHSAAGLPEVGPRTVVEPCAECAAPLDVTALEPLTPVACPVCSRVVVVQRQVRQFTLLTQIGRGGMGVVYRATDNALARDVALKLLRRDRSGDPEYLAQIEAEAGITASLNHPNVVRVYSSGMDGDRFFIAMELVEGGTLDERITAQGRLPEWLALQVAIHAARGLKAAQEAGLIHRDVKPGNILFGANQIAKIVDFGLAMKADELQEEAAIWGTPYYVAPEKLERHVEDFRSDMYSLGATIFHALAGRPPFEAADASLVALKHVKNQAVSLQAFAPHVSTLTAFAINRTLLKNPDDRFQSYDELIQHLEYAASQLGGARTVKASTAMAIESRRQQTLMTRLTVATAFLAAVASAVAVWMVTRQVPKPPVPPPPAAAVVADSAKIDSPPWSLLASRDWVAAAAKYEDLLKQEGGSIVEREMYRLELGLSQWCKGNVATARNTLDELAAHAKDDRARFRARALLDSDPFDAARHRVWLNTDPIAAAMVGMREWARGDKAKAVELLRAYRNATRKDAEGREGVYWHIASRLLQS